MLFTELGSSRTDSKIKSSRLSGPFDVSRHLDVSLEFQREVKTRDTILGVIINDIQSHRVGDKR